MATEYITETAEDCEHQFYGIYRHPTTDVKCAKCGKILTHDEYLLWKGGQPSHAVCRHR